MKKISKSTILLTIIACLTIGLAPFTPQPHVWGKIEWIAGGARGMKWLDYADLLMHGAPWVILIVLLCINLIALIKSK